MRLEHVGAGEVDVVGGHERQPRGVGDLDVAALRQALVLGQAVLARVALELDVETVGVGLGQPGHELLGLLPAPGAQEAPHGAVGAAGEADQAVRVRREVAERDLWLAGGLGEVELRLEREEVEVAGLALREEHDGRGRHRLGAGGDRDVFEVELDAQDGLDPGLGRALRELQRGEHGVGVRERDGRHPGLRGHGGKRLDANGALQDRELGMDAQVDESGIGHGGKLGSAAGGHQARRGRAAGAGVADTGGRLPPVAAALRATPPVGPRALRGRRARPSARPSRHGRPPALWPVDAGGRRGRGGGLASARRIGTLRGFKAEAAGVHRVPSQRRGRAARGRAGGAHAARLAAGRAGPQRHQGGVQRGRLRRVHGARDRRGRHAAAQRVHPSAAAAPRARRAHGGGDRRTGRRAASGAAGDGGAPRLAMRILHAGLRGDHGRGAPARTARPRRPARGVPVPLHGLRAHRAGRAAAEDAPAPAWMREELGRLAGRDERPGSPANGAGGEEAPARGRGGEETGGVAYRATPRSRPTGGGATPWPAPGRPTGAATGRRAAGSARPPRRRWRPGTPSTPTPRSSRARPTWGCG